ncbi:hypothetical protein EWM64_g9615 [Hericium alpestre]|uniref:Mannosyltransferase n=1 Tax=Hericium alpestre TaxID=135208 RepID=A0A4Y9ZK43_9AGAM|nr:hypothetical protein EWM64_g9615 [Hericium alpestre]
MSFVLDICILATGWLHVLLAPYTKVEESFNLHATHDVLLYGISSATLDNYDHFMFPGVVPRSFLGSVLLAWLSTPMIHLCNHFGLISSKFDLQIIINISTYLLINRNRNAQRPSQTAIGGALALLIFTAVIFRAEVALLAIVIAFQSLLNGNLRLSRFILVGFLASISAIALTVAIDSYFWRQWPMWPELQALYFNVYEGKSAEWGVSPWHTYFTSFLPKLLLGALPLSLPGILDHRIRAIVLPCILYVGLISLLGHKEWRFIVYVIPPLNIAAARGARWMYARPPLPDAVLIPTQARLAQEHLHRPTAVPNRRGHRARKLPRHSAPYAHGNGELPWRRSLARFNAEYADAQDGTPPLTH